MFFRISLYQEHDRCSLAVSEISRCGKAYHTRHQRAPEGFVELTADSDSLLSWCVFNFESAVALHRILPYFWYKTCYLAKHFSQYRCSTKMELQTLIDPISEDDCSISIFYLNCLMSTGSFFAA
uniref:Uncharacterized protein n=1 Tax=Photinus pyralis TaxID=7054 RepID=A0A1Y1MMK4_PHOPY